MVKPKYYFRIADNSHYDNRIYPGDYGSSTFGLTKPNKLPIYTRLVNDYVLELQRHILSYTEEN